MDGLRAASAGSGSGVLFDPSVFSLRGAESEAQTTAKRPDLFIAWPFYKATGTAVGCCEQHIPASTLNWAAYTGELSAPVLWLLEAIQKSDICLFLRSDRESFLLGQLMLQLQLPLIALPLYIQVTNDYTKATNYNHYIMQYSKNPRNYPATQSRKTRG